MLGKGVSLQLGNRMAYLEKEHCSRCYPEIGSHGHMLKLIVWKEILHHMPEDYSGRLYDLFDVLLVPVVETCIRRGN